MIRPNDNRDFVIFADFTALALIPEAFSLSKKSTKSFVSFVIIDFIGMKKRFGTNFKDFKLQ